MQSGGAHRISRGGSRYRGVLLLSFLLCLLLCDPSQAQTDCERDHARRPGNPPADISYDVGGGALVSRLIADLLKPAVDDGQVVADLSVSFTVEPTRCPRPISFP